MRRLVDMGVLLLCFLTVFGLIGLGFMASQRERERATETKREVERMVATHIRLYEAKTGSTFDCYAAKREARK